MFSTLYRGDMEKTTALALNARAKRYVDTLQHDDPLRMANALMDRAIKLQDAGRMDEAETLLARAEALI